MIIIDGMMIMSPITGRAASRWWPKGGEEFGREGETDGEEGGCYFG